MNSIKLEGLEGLKALKKELEQEQNELSQYEQHPQYNLIKKAQNKEKLTVEEQVAYLKFKGITFNHTSEPEAKKHLAENSYYYKITAYRKNFLKNGENKYQNLDFANLKDLAVIDMHLRYLLLKLSLDIEHAIKTKLMNLITASDEDGYVIVEEYNDYQYNSINDSKLTAEQKQQRKDNYVHSSVNILKGSENPQGYHRDLYEKHNNKPSIWVLIELMSYGQVASFIKFYVERKKFGYKELKNASDFMHFSKNIRDSAAHSRPVLLNIIEPLQFTGRPYPKQKLKQYLFDARIPKRLVNTYLTNVKTHDLCTLLYLHDNYVKGSRAREERKKELINLFQRARREKKLYKESQELGEILLILGTLIRRYNY
ncbi:MULTISPECIES: Abi family protein [Bacillus cereus group]|uniref:Abi family protein n=1 Tax=Bacillus cereus group TaxID=86661 RepID=UPI0022E2F009|nr:Abi family protein [Bacillus cereus group sp. BY105LC]MDA1887238.1 Abi family protein [Bacillus cereus group sp. BY105LC]